MGYDWIVYSRLYLLVWLGKFFVLVVSYELYIFCSIEDGLEIGEM